MMMMILLAANKKKKKRDPVIMKRSERSDWLQNTKGDGDALRRFFSLDSFIFYFIFFEPLGCQLVIKSMAIFG
jgi:hypothetical protein